MARVSKKYASLGLRRDKNFSDLVNPTVALNNLLNSIETIAGQNFVSEDLDAFRGQKNTGITKVKLAELANTTSKVSVASGNTVQEIEVNPLIRIKDKVENVRIVTGSVPALQGGQGLLARFIAGNQINVGSRSSTGATIFTVDDFQPREVFWNRGYFNFETTIHPTFDSQAGGIQWTGYFCPNLYDDAPEIRYETTGLFIIEYDPLDNGNWVVLKNIFAATRTVTVNLAAVNTTTVELINGDTRFVAVDDTLVITPEPSEPITITAITGNVITLSSAITVTLGQVLTFTKIIGDTNTSGGNLFDPVDIGQYIKLKLSVWWPTQEASYVSREIWFRQKENESELSYPLLYADLPPTPSPTEIRTILTQVVTPFQPNVGTSGSNRGIYAGNSFKVLYSPKSSLGQVTVVSNASVTFNPVTTVLRSTSNLNTAPIGSYIVPTVARASTRINKLLQVTATVSDTIKVLNAKVDTAGTEVVNFVDYNGFIGWFYATSSGTTVTLQNFNNTNIRNDYIVITPTSTTTSFIRVTGKSSTNVITTNTAINLSGEQIILVYSDKGLIDSSKDTFCSGVFGRTLASTANTGATSFVVTDATGIASGQVVQFGTSINSGNTATVASVSGTTINLSAQITATILVGNTIVFCPAGTTLNKEGCVIPLNTAPPFEGTLTGLSSVDYGLRSNVSTLQVNCSSLQFEVPSADVDLAAAGVLTFDRRYVINSTFAILAKKV